MRKRLPGLFMLLMILTAVGAETLLAVGSKRIVLNHFIADPKQ
jgi:hypothetical protein